MKKIAYAFGLVVLTFSACEKNESNYDMLRSNIVGEWVINHTGQEIRADTMYREFDYFFEAAFNADGTGSREVTTFIVDTTIQFSWYYQYSPQQVIIIPEPAGPIPSSIVVSVPPQAHDVYTNEPDRQVWEHESDDPLNIADVFLHTWEMERK